MLLRVHELETYYGRAQALKGISMEVAKGELITILGANGAGKTTLLRTISGFIQPKKGLVKFEDQKIEHLDPEAVVRLGLSHCPEGRKLFPE